MAAGTGEDLSADEIALYDRQLRLWGIEAQNRMRKASVLLVTMRALGNEIAKNLVLAGIGSLTVLDPDTVTEADIASEFFVTEEHIGRNVFLNSVRIFADEGDSVPKQLLETFNDSIQEFSFVTIHRKLLRRL
jgi:molybdopterin/thiamine biosynthesis adenylyltransferase